MYTFTVVVHVSVCFLMIAAILLQAGKGAEIGAAFGGSSQTVFGSRGPANFLSKVTVAAAVIFMVTSLTLAYLSRQGAYSSTVIDLDAKESVTTPATAPADEETSGSPAGTSQSTDDATPSPASP